MVQALVDGKTTRLARRIALLAALPVAACAGPGGGPGAGGIPADEAVWASLERERPAPLSGAPRIAVSEIIPLGSGLESGLEDPPGGGPDGDRGGGVSDGSGTSGEPDRASLAVGLQELVSLGLIRRRDVQFVERRRFGPAAELERRGVDRPPEAPAVGSSPGAEMVLSGTWSPVGPDSAYLDLRLADAETGRVISSWRTATPRRADPTSVARTAVGGLLEELREADRKPVWTDPLATSNVPAAPAAYQNGEIGPGATAAFLRGLAAEDRYDWEAARIGYQRALEEADGRFFEAEEALARTARLRAGGTLGES
ncbi:MAG: hypothetical protein R3223_09095 [Longimicrobiales bacterium]|nr:hypothetical protein [Longimicrobiales bacterium]